MLRQTLVHEARKEYMNHVENHSLFTNVPMQECRTETGKGPIGTIWVDTNKGDSTPPEYMSKLVSQDTCI